MTQTNSTETGDDDADAAGHLKGTSKCSGHCDNSHCEGSIWRVLLTGRARVVGAQPLSAAWQHRREFPNKELDVNRELLGNADWRSVHWMSR